MNASPSKPLVIPVFIPHAGCPHRCIFCNQTPLTQTASSLPSSAQLHQQIQHYLEFADSARRKTVQISFYGGNFLGLPPSDIRRFLTEVEPYVLSGKVNSLRFSTRPDTITPERLELLKPFPVQTVELGVQSMDDEVLRLSRRGHTSEDTRKAAALLQAENYETGLQMMTGLPGDSAEKAADTARQLIALKPDFIRIYPALVLKGSPLGNWFEKGRYIPQPMEEAVTLVKTLYLLFHEADIPVIRMGLQASDELDSGRSVLAGPYHPAFGELVFSEIFLDRAVSQLSSASVEEIGMPVFYVHPRSISKMRGIRNKNIEILKKLLNTDQIKTVPDETLVPLEVRFEKQL